MSRTPLLRRTWLVPAALGLQLAAVYALPASGDAMLRRVCLLTAYGLLLAVVWANRGRWCMRLLGVGLLLNLAALAVGHGLMPVAPDTARSSGLAPLVADLRLGQPVPRSKDVLMARSSTPLWPITDSIAVHRGALHYAISPGDLVISLAILLGVLELPAIEVAALRVRQARSPA